MPQLNSSAPVRPYASILIPMDLAPETGRRAELAASLADRFSSRLIGVAAHPSPLRCMSRLRSKAWRAFWKSRRIAPGRTLAATASAASAKTQRKPAASVADELVRSAESELADLIVCGAYGHSRIGEWVFGGVTRDLLDHAPICCLMAH